MFFVQVPMPQGDKQHFSSGVGSPPATPGTYPSVLEDITNSASSRSPKASSKSPAILHNQPSDAPSFSAPMLLVTSGDSYIPAHMASLGNTADNPMKINDSSTKAVSSDGDHHSPDGESSSDDSTSSSSSTTSGSGSYTDSSASAVITDGSSQSSDDSGSLIGSPVSKHTRHKQKSSGHCHPSSRSHSQTPTTGSQAITITDDKDRSPSPKCHHESHTCKKHKKHEHNSQVTHCHRRNSVHLTPQERSHLPRLHLLQAKVLQPPSLLLLPKV